MAGNIKGITIEFRGDTTKLDKALRNINHETKETSKELKKIDSLLKLKPGNVDALKLKYQALTSQIASTEEKLKALKEAQQKANEDPNVDKNSAEYRELQREIIATEQNLKDFKKKLAELANVNLRALGEQFVEIGKKIKSVGDTMTKYISVPIAGLFTVGTKNALEFEDALGKIMTIADPSQRSIGEISDELINLSNASGRSTDDLAEAYYQALSASIETKDAAQFLETAANLSKAGFLETADSVDVLTTIINAYGYSAEDADMIANQLIATQNKGKTTVNQLSQAMGQVIPTAAALNIPLEQLNASYVILTKQGINTANATTYLNGMFTELADGGSTVSTILQNKTGKTFGQLMADGYSLADVLKILYEDVNGDGEAFLNLWGNVRAGRGALALANGGFEEFNATTVDMLNSTGLMGDALEQLDTPASRLRKSLNQLKNAGIEIGERLTPLVQRFADFLTGMLEKWDALDESAQNAILTVLGIVAVLGPLLSTIGSVAIGIGQLLIMGPTVLAMMAPFAPMILTIIAVLTVLISVGVLLIKHWDQIKAKAVELWNRIKAVFAGIKNSVTSAINSVKTFLSNAWNSIKATASAAWNGIRNAIVSPIQKARDTVRSIIDRIKDFFPIKVGNLLSGIKLPKFSIEGSFSLVPPRVPRITWHKDGAIFNKPTVFPHGLGEAGPEAVVPLDTLWNKLDKIAAASESGGDGITINVYGTPGMDVNQLAAAVEARLVRLQQQRAKAWQ